MIGLQLAGLTSDLARAALLTAVAYGVLFPLSERASLAWTFSGPLSRSVVMTLAAAVAGCAAWTIFHSARGSRWYFAGGLVVGLLLLLAR